MSGDRFERIEALALFREWFANCGQALAIIGPEHSGKTFFAQQLSELPECVASHFCRYDEPQSSETATLIQSIGDQLSKKFPNLVLPRLSTVTLLKNGRNVLEHFLRLPLDSMPKPVKPVFLIIDNVDDERTRKLVEMIRQILPTWIRLVLTTRKFDATHPSDTFHLMTINTDQKDLDRFIRFRLPHLSSSEVLMYAQGTSWFYVDLLHRFNLDTSLIDQSGLISKVRNLNKKCFDEVINVLATSRNRPSFQQILAVLQLLAPRDISILEQDLKRILALIAENDNYSQISVHQKWAELYYEPQLAAQYHAVWAEHFKTKRRKSAQDIVELAYHLAHSPHPRAAVKTLQSVGAARISMKCAVIDAETTELLLSAGAHVDENDDEFGIENENDVVYSCSIGNVENLEHILTRVKPTTLEMCYGLLIASARGHLKMCQYIIDTFPSLTKINCGEWNALRSAACNGQLEVLDLLLSKGVNVDECGTSDRTALRAAAWSGQLAAVQLLLQNGANVHRRDSEKRTALMAAAFMGHRDVVDVILQYGADVNATDNSGATALHLNLANTSKHPQMHEQTTRLLLDAASTSSGDDDASVATTCDIADANGRLALHLAAYHGDASLSRICALTRRHVVDAADSQGQTPLILAASQGKIDAVRYLVAESAADLDFIDVNGRTALQWAAINGHEEVVEYLCQAGADESHKDNDGAIALHYSVAHASPRLSSLLINDQTIATCDRYGQPPLIVACRHGHVAVVAELISAATAASQDIVNVAAHDGRTAIGVAAVAGHVAVCQLLAPYVLDWCQADHDGVPLVHSLIVARQTRVAEMMFALGTATTVSDSHGRTCAHVVASTNDITSAKMLRHVGASFECCDTGGRTPLMTAIWSRHLQIAQFLLDTCGVDPNRCDQQGATSLSIACQLGAGDLVALLLRFGADTQLRDSAGRTASDVARLTGNAAILNVLRRGGATDGSDSGSSGIGSSVPNSPPKCRATSATPATNSSRRATSLVRVKL